MHVFEATVYNNKFKAGIGNEGELVTYNLCSGCDPMQTYFRSIPTGHYLDEAIVVDRHDISREDLDGWLALMKQQSIFSGYNCCRNIKMPSIHRQLDLMLEHAAKLKPGTIATRYQGEVDDEWEMLERHPSLHLLQ